MPELPTKESVFGARPTPTPRRQILTYDNTSLAEAGIRRGRAVSEFGDDLAKIAKKRKEEEDELEIIKAKADLDKMYYDSIDQADQDSELYNNVDTHKKTFSANALTTLNGISDPRRREIFNAQFIQPKITEQGHYINQKSFDARDKYNQATALSSVETQVGNFSSHAMRGNYKEASDAYINSLRAIDVSYRNDPVAAYKAKQVVRGQFMTAFGELPLDTRGALLTSGFSSGVEKPERGTRPPDEFNKLLIDWVMYKTEGGGVRVDDPTDKDPNATSMYGINSAVFGEINTAEEARAIYNQHFIKSEMELYPESFRAAAFFLFVNSGYDPETRSLVKQANGDTEKLISFHKQKMLSSGRHTEKSANTRIESLRDFIRENADDTASSPPETIVTLFGQDGYNELRNNYVADVGKKKEDISGKIALDKINLLESKSAEELQNTSIDAILSPDEVVALKSEDKKKIEDRLAFLRGDIEKGSATDIALGEQNFSRAQQEIIFNMSDKTLPEKRAYIIGLNDITEKRRNDLLAIANNTASENTAANQQALFEEVAKIGLDMYPQTGNESEDETKARVQRRGFFERQLSRAIASDVEKYNKEFPGKKMSREEIGEIIYSHLGKETVKVSESYIDRSRSRTGQFWAFWNYMWGEGETTSNIDKFTFDKLSLDPKANITPPEVITDYFNDNPMSGDEIAAAKEEIGRIRASGKDSPYTSVQAEIVRDENGKPVVVNGKTEYAISDTEIMYFVLDKRIKAVKGVVARQNSEGVVKFTEK